MKVGSIDVIPLAAESMGVRSLSTLVTTPDVSILLDPSAALSKRNRLEPHPLEYSALLKALERIFVTARRADVLSISHYHFDHVRPGFTDFQYIFSSLEELKRMFKDKVVYAKDNREMINPSQRRRGFFFERDLKGVAQEIHWADGKSYTFGETTITYSLPLPHGPQDSRLGYVLATSISTEEETIVFAPDVQGPIVSSTRNYLLETGADLIILGGPPIYIESFRSKYNKDALDSLTLIASATPTLVVDHHLMRSPSWAAWLKPVTDVAEKQGHTVSTMAELAGGENKTLESVRQSLYSSFPPSDEFLDWTKATDDYKKQNRPPVN